MYRIVNVQIHLRFDEPENDCNKHTCYQGSNGSSLWRFHLTLQVFQVFPAALLVTAII
jgi:hypothetical protein